MNFNLITYAIYLPIICFIMVKVGWLFYKNGEIFLINLFNQDISVIKSINNLLLIGYYLTNIGYAIITISYWSKLNSLLEVVNSLAYTLGKIILILAILHYNNIFWLKYLNKTNALKH